MLDENTERFLCNLYRKNVPIAEPESGMTMINLALVEAPLGDPVMSDDELAVFASAFEVAGFTGCINWYRNMARNWHFLADVDPVIHQPALMIYGDRDSIPRSENLADFVPNVDLVGLDCGHWIQREKPEETTEAILSWPQRQEARPGVEAVPSASAVGGGQ